GGRRRTKGRADARRLRLSESEARMLEWAERRLAIEAAATGAGSEDEALAALATLIEAGLVELGADPDGRQAGRTDGSAGPRLSQTEEKTLAHYKDILVKAEGADHYQILNVPTTASEEDLRKAY